MLQRDTATASHDQARASVAHACMAAHGQCCQCADGQQAPVNSHITFYVHQAKDTQPTCKAGRREFILMLLLLVLQLIGSHAPKPTGQARAELPRSRGMRIAVGAVRRVMWLLGAASDWASKTCKGRQSLRLWWTPRRDAQLLVLPCECNDMLIGALACTDDHAFGRYSPDAHWAVMHRTVSVS